LTRLLLATTVTLSGCTQPNTPQAVTWPATASMPDGRAPDAATLDRARGIVAARLRIGDLPPTRVETDGDRTLLIRLEWEDDFGFDVAERLRPGEVLLRPVLRQAIEPSELRDVSPSNQPRPDEVAAMAPETQFGAPTPTCDLLLVREPADTADPSKPVASCSRDHTLSSTKYLLGPAIAMEADIAAVRCARRPDSWSELVFSFTEQGRPRMRAETGMVAVVLDGIVLATVGPEARDDEMTIEGYFLPWQVAVLCAEPRYASLPVTLRPEFAR
jgi:hypothetical protein